MAVEGNGAPAGATPASPLQRRGGGRGGGGGGGFAGGGGVGGWGRGGAGGGTPRQSAATAGGRSGRAGKAGGAPGVTPPKDQDAAVFEHPGSCRSSRQRGRHERPRTGMRMIFA